MMIITLDENKKFISTKKKSKKKSYWEENKPMPDYKRKKMKQHRQSLEDEKIEAGKMRAQQSKKKKSYVTKGEGEISKMVHEQQSATRPAEKCGQ